MSESNEIDQPYKGQKFASFEHLKKYLEEYAQKNYVKFWIRSSHKRNSLKSRISKTMNPDLKYVSIKFACIFGGEKIRCRGSGIRKSYTYRNLGCPCMINAVVGEDGNHVKLDTVILEHNHALCKSLYDSLNKTKRKSLLVKTEKNENKSDENIMLSKKDFPTTEKFLDNTVIPKETDNSLKVIKDEAGEIVKVLVVNSDIKIQKETETRKSGIYCDNSQICRLCLSSKENLSPIFNPDLPVESTVLSFKIMGCASIEISSDDGLPNNICSSCEADLDIAYNFRIRCEKSDSILREMYDKTQTLSDSNYLKENNSENEETFQPAIIINSEDKDLLELIQPSKVKSNDSESYVVVCPVCNSKFESYETMIEHLGTHWNEDAFLFACNMCNWVCSTVKDLQHHIKEHSKDENEIWTCEIGGTNSENSESQVQEVTKEETRTKKTMKFLCNICGKVFSTKDRFQSHVNMHEGLRPHVCFECGRGFADRKNLHQHYDVVHLRKVRHECPVCQRKFYTRTKMRSHMTMHSGDKPFTCDLCGKTFRLKMNMYKHMKTHTNIKPYQCDKCSAAFTERNLLKRHSYKHGGVRPYQCPVCGHGFSARFCLKKHLKDSKCRGVIIEDPQTYSWLSGTENVGGQNDENCIVVYKTEDSDTLEETETMGLSILEELREQTNT